MIFIVILLKKFVIVIDVFNMMTKPHGLICTKANIKEFKSYSTLKAEENLQNGNEESTFYDT